MMPESPYVFGHSQSELSRLAKQGTFYALATEDMMLRAGITPGMRVLDVGSGAGDVALLAARLVGASGVVVGVERSAEAAALAQARAAADGLTWCRFIVSDVDNFTCDETFDAMVGRLVLMYLPDPAATIRSLARHLRPNGIVAFQELYLSAATAIPDGPLFAQYLKWISELFGHARVEIDMGPKLFATYRRAGLSDPKMLGAMQIVSNVDPLGYEIFSAIVRSLSPLFERFGVVTARELDVDTLEHRLREEAMTGGRIHVFPPLIGAWSRIST
jgi:SAM-dependent methyltransferase